MESIRVGLPVSLNISEKLSMDRMKTRKRASSSNIPPSGIKIKKEDTVPDVAMEKRPKTDDPAVQESCIIGTTTLANHKLAWEVKALQDENDDLKQFNQELKNQIKTLTTENKLMKCKLKTFQPCKLYFTIKRKNEMIRHWRDAYYKLKYPDKTVRKLSERINVKNSCKLKTTKAYQSQQRLHASKRQTYDHDLTDETHIVKRQLARRQQVVADQQTDRHPENQSTTFLYQKSRANTMQTNTDGKTRAPAGPFIRQDLPHTGIPQNNSSETVCQRTSNVTGTEFIKEHSSYGTLNPSGKEIRNLHKQKLKHTLSKEHSALISDNTAVKLLGKPLEVDQVTRDRTCSLHGQQVRVQRSAGNQTSRPMETNPVPSISDTSTSPIQQMNSAPSSSAMEMCPEREIDVEHAENHPKPGEHNIKSKEEDPIRMHSIMARDMPFVIKVIKEYNKIVYIELSKKNPVPSNEESTDQVTVSVLTEVPGGSCDVPGSGLKYVVPEEVEKNDTDIGQTAENLMREDESALTGESETSCPQNMAGLDAGDTDTTHDVNILSDQQDPQRAGPNKGKTSQKIRKPDRFCVYCKKVVKGGQLNRHIRRKHRYVPEVQNILKQPKAVQYQFFEQKRKDGIYEYNYNLISNEKEPEMRERKPVLKDELRLCAECKGFFSNKCFFKHKCSKSSNPTAIKPMLLQKIREQEMDNDKDFQDILCRFRGGDVGGLIRTNTTIQLLGYKHFKMRRHEEGEDHMVRKAVMSDMRELARLYVTFKEISGEEKSVKDMLNRENLQDLMAAIERVVTTGNKKEKLGLKSVLDALIIRSVKFLLGLQDEKHKELMQFLTAYKCKT